MLSCCSADPESSSQAGSLTSFHRTNFHMKARLKQERTNHSISDLEPVFLFPLCVSAQTLILSDTTIICNLCCEASLAASAEEQREEWRATAGKYLPVYPASAFQSLAFVGSA